MRTPLFTLCILMFSFVFSSCETDDVNSDAKNYWSSNALVRMTLKAKVKTLTLDDGKHITEFNDKGNISKEIYKYTADVMTTTFNYGTNGELNNTTTVSAGENPTTSTTTYTYDTHGRYVVQAPFHLHQTGLVPNLKSIVTEYGTSTFVFKNDNLLIIYSNKQVNDTTIIKYDGKYPSSYLGKNSFMRDLSFAKNGMFLKYSEGFHGQGYEDTRVYTFKEDDDYMLLKSMKSNSVSTEGSYTSSWEITYNENKDIATEVQDQSQTEYFDYVYDKSNNWTSRKIKRRENSSAKWSEPLVENRVITYWN